jgi:transposase
MREQSVAEQRYKAVLAVIGEGKSVTEVAAEWRVSRQTLHTWLARYEAGGLEALGDGSHRPAKCPHQMSPELEAMVLELRRYKPYWGPRSLFRSWRDADSHSCSSAATQGSSFDAFARL